MIKRTPTTGHTTPDTGSSDLALKSPSSSDSTISDGNEAKQVEVGGEHFEEGNECPFCLFQTGQTHQLTKNNAHAHLMEATHRRSMTDFKIYLDDELPTEVRQLYNSMVKATTAVSTQNPYAFIATMKKRTTISSNSDGITSAVSSCSTSSLEGLPSPSLFQSPYNGHEDGDGKERVKDYYRRTLKVKENEGRLMTQKDWALFDAIARREGIGNAMQIFQGTLICRDCDKKLPYEHQIVEHLKSPGHKDVLRRLLVDMEGPNTPVQRRNWSEAPQRASRKRGNVTPADPRKPKRHHESNSNLNGKIAWPCLGCKATCIASKNAKFFVCTLCHVGQKPQL